MAVIVCLCLCLCLCLSRICCEHMYVAGMRSSFPSLPNSRLTSTALPHPIQPIHDLLPLPLLNQHGHRAFKIDTVATIRLRKRLLRLVLLEAHRREALDGYVDRVADLRTRGNGDGLRVRVHGQLVAGTDGDGEGLDGFVGAAGFLAAGGGGGGRSGGGTERGALELGFERGFEDVFVLAEGKSRGEAGQLGDWWGGGGGCAESVESCQHIWEVAHGTLLGDRDVFVGRVLALGADLFCVSSTPLASGEGRVGRAR